MVQFANPLEVAQLGSGQLAVAVVASLIVQWEPRQVSPQFEGSLNLPASVEWQKEPPPSGIVVMNRLGRGFEQVLAELCLT